LNEKELAEVGFSRLTVLRPGFLMTEEKRVKRRVMPGGRSIRCWTCSLQTRLGFVGRAMRRLAIGGEKIAEVFRSEGGVEFVENMSIVELGGW